MHFWSPGRDPDHPLAGEEPERFVLRRLGSGRYIAIDPRDQSLVDGDDAAGAHGFHTHEAALRAAGELQRLGQKGSTSSKSDDRCRIRHRPGPRRRQAGHDRS